ncbi:MAG: tetratricopeptide repeat protein, partial [Candidatus Omnitrophota bacterium]
PCPTAGRRTPPQYEKEKMKKNKKLEQLDFEIEFFEKLLKEKPDFIEVLMPLADAYTKRGHYEKGLAIDKKLSELKPDDPVVWYNLSCSLSLLNKTDKSLEAMKQALAHGYNDMEYLLSDPDLASLRETPGFKELLFKLKNYQN